jgi:hypothetical protein
VSWRIAREPGMADLQSATDTMQPIANYDGSDNDAERLASSLALLARKSPDLALIVERWDTLPEVLRAGILAMIRGCKPEA